MHTSELIAGHPSRAFRRRGLSIRARASEWGPMAVRLFRRGRFAPASKPAPKVGRNVSAVIARVPEADILLWFG
jgi:hypothetical protein